MIIPKDEYNLKHKLDWELLTKATANFTTHILYINAKNELRSKRTLFCILFLFLFFSVGSWLLLFVTLDDPFYRSGQAMFSDEGFWGDMLSLGLSIAFIFGGASGLLYNKEVTVKPNSGSIDIVDVHFFNEKKRVVFLVEVKILQLIKHFNESDDDSYYSYELNLVLNDLSRINIIAHGGEKRAIKDAKLLSEFINKQITSNFA